MVQAYSELRAEELTLTVPQISPDQELGPAIDVVIVNWNTGNQLARCLDGLESGVAAQRLNLIIVDNASHDGSVVAPARGRVIDNEQNLGFAVACNQGARAGSAPYVLFLNPDTEVNAETIVSAVSTLSADDRIGVVGIQLRDREGHVQRSCARQPNSIMLACHAIGLTRIWPKTGYVMGEWDHNSDRDVDHVIGAFYLIRRELYKRLGGFDERFFLYLEDLDLSRRVLNSGYKIRFVCDSSILHIGGGSSAQIPDTRLYLSLRARITFSGKHFKAPGHILVVVATLIVEPIVRLLVGALRPSATPPGQVVRAYRSLFSWLFR